MTTDPSPNEGTNMTQTIIRPPQAPMLHGAATDPGRESSMPSIVQWAGQMLDEFIGLAHHAINARRNQEQTDNDDQQIEADG